MSQAKSKGQGKKHHVIHTHGPTKVEESSEKTTETKHPPLRFGDYQISFEEEVNETVTGETYDFLQDYYINGSTGSISPLANHVLAKAKQVPLLA